MLAFLFFFIWLRGTLPRFRYDQLMHFGWKVLVPVAMLNPGRRDGLRGWLSDEPRPDAILFYVFAALARSARRLVVVGQRNPIYSAFALIVTLCSLSAIFGLLGSPFIAVLQIVVYAGAIMVLFLFVLMLLNVKREEHDRRAGPHSGESSRSLLGALLVVQVALVLPALGAAARPLPQLRRLDARHGRACCSRRRYLYVFEATSILILAALVGAVVAGEEGPVSHDTRPARPAA